MAALPSSPEKGPQLTQSAETQKLIVHMPDKMKELGTLLDALDTIDAIPSRVSEMTGEDRSSDMGSAGKSGTRAVATAKQISPRDQKIAAISTDPEVLKGQLTAHIKKEVEELARQAKTIERMNKPGAAFQLTKLYARIRRLNGFVAEIIHASYDTLKRLFVRVFIDEQPIV